MLIGSSSSSSSISINNSLSSGLPLHPSVCMDPGPIVIDISSDEEFDECRVDGSIDDILKLLEQDGGECVNNDIVDVDQYFYYSENSDCLRPQSSARDELDDDCMVLDGDPDKPVDVGDAKRKGGDGSDDLQIVGQKGQVACRDFPHSRHLCANFPFNTTPHEKHCKLCHCFVCDSPAPCTYWCNGVSLTDHCHAIDRDDTWKAQRRFFKRMALPQKPKHPFLPPVRTPQSIPRPFKGIPLHSSTTTTSSSSSRYVPTEKHHQNHRNLIRRLPVPPTVSHAQFKKIGITGSGHRSSSLNRPQSTPSGPHQMQRSVIQRAQFSARALPGARSIPVTSERSPSTPMVASEDYIVKRWRDILEGFAAELGVSDSISKDSTASQPPDVYFPDSSSQGIEPHGDLGSTTITSNSVDFEPKWLDGPTDEIFPGQSDAVCGDINIESFFTAADEIVPGPEKVIGPPEVDPSSFLYDFEGKWSSTSNGLPQSDHFHSS